MILCTSNVHTLTASLLLLSLQPLPPPRIATASAAAATATDNPSNKPKTHSTSKDHTSFQLGATESKKTSALLSKQKFDKDIDSKWCIGLLM